MFTLIAFCLIAAVLNAYLPPHWDADARPLHRCPQWPAKALRAATTALRALVAGLCLYVATHLIERRHDARCDEMRAAQKLERQAKTKAARDSWLRVMAQMSCVGDGMEGVGL